MRAPLSAAETARQERLAAASLEAQHRAEAADSEDFETFRRNYLAPERLVPA
jgi:hypothetical protein